MKMIWIGSLVVATFSGEAEAAKVPENDLNMFRKACVASLTLHRHIGERKPSEFDGKYAPKDEKKLPAYCACVMKRYWASVPQAHYDAEVTAAKRGNTPVEETSDDDEEDPAMEAAKKACRA